MLYLGGGGDTADEYKLWDLAFQPGYKVTIWPFAHGPEMLDFILGYVKDELNPRGDYTLTVGDKGPHYGLEDADLLHIPGGNTFALLAYVREHGMEQSLLSFLARGGKVYGTSAGSLLLARDINIINSALGPTGDRNDVKLEDTTGLNFLQGMDVYPHYKADSEPQRVFCQKWADEHAVPVAGLDECGGLTVDDKGKAYNPGPADVVIHMPGSEPVILKEGETWSLKDRKKEA
ncbi:class I glutamine amidotransferase-like protein [Thozetella sp. PMI_491]|nr:class I glutamine amidotransferase-like protein [Thozetella sp. PMI_491]